MRALIFAAVRRRARMADNYDGKEHTDGARMQPDMG